MKIAFPVISNNKEKSRLADHFGRAPMFTVFDDSKKQFEVIDNSGEHFGGRLPAPEVLKNHNINILICKGLGRKAIALFDNLGICVHLTQSSIVEDALAAYQKGELQQATQTDGCAGRGHRH